MRTPRNLVATLLVMLLLGTQARAQSQHSSNFLAKQCNEAAIELHLDPSLFQAIVGPEYSLVLDEGKARVLIVVQDCFEYWIDGEDCGPTQDVHVWVLIHGLEDVRPVVGAQQTLPTRTWFALFSGTSNPRVRKAKKVSGTVVSAIDSVSLDPPGPELAGRVSLERNLNYSWHVASPATPSVRLLGLNHDVYVRSSAGNVLLNRVQALVHVVAGTSQGTLRVVGESDLLPLIQPGTYPVSVRTFFPMWARTMLGLSPSR
jgi:hypothetical protein